MVSCGIIIEDKDGAILGCHATGRKFEKNTYDIPKGCLEKGETPNQCITRELREETGIELERCGYIRDLGVKKYIKGKDLHLFYIKLDVDLENLKCSSWFKNKEGIEMPEIDGYKWIYKEELDWFYNSLSKVIKETLEEIKNG